MQLTLIDLDPGSLLAGYVTYQITNNFKLYFSHLQNGYNYQYLPLGTVLSPTSALNKGWLLILLISL